MGRIFDATALTILIALQWPLAKQVLRRASGGSRRRYLAGVAACCVFFLALAAGIALSVSELVSWFHLPPALALACGGAALFYLFCSSGAVAIHLVWQWISRRLSPEHPDPGRRALLSAAGGAFATFPFALLGYGALVQRTDFQVKEVDVPLPGLPADLDGLRLVQLSDIHLSAFLSEPELARVVDMANEARANVALVTGDLISVYGDPLDACIRQLSRLRADAGVFGCLGNHERYAGAENYATAAGARMGIRFLRRRAERLRFGNASINLAGFDYEPIAHRGHYLRGAERFVARDALNVLLSHNPDVFPEAARKGYDLTLSGHTHGGQVSVEILDQSINPARFFTPYVYGLYREGGRAIYVTRGIGTIGVPARIGAAPEISVLRLRKA